MILTVWDRIEALVLADPEGAEMARWARELAPCPSTDRFVGEATWVILCSGVSFRAARTMERTLHETGRCAHPLKARAIGDWRAHGAEWWERYRAAEDDAARLEFLRTLPFMRGRALVYQLAKNLGLTSYAKPDRHLIRIAAEYETDPQSLCEAIAAARELTVAYVDTVIWYAAARRWWPARQFDAARAVRSDAWRS